MTPSKEINTMMPNIADKNKRVNSAVRERLRTMDLLYSPRKALRIIHTGTSKIIVEIKDAGSASKK